MRCAGDGPGWKRYLLAYLSCLGFAVLFSMRCELTLAVIMLNHAPCVAQNCTSPRLSPTIFGKPIVVHWTNTEIGIVESAFFAGYAASNFPAGFIATFFPSHAVLGIAMFCSFVLNLTIPIFLFLGNDGIYPFIIVRILQGVVEGCIYPGIVAFWRLWAPSSEKAKLVTLSFLGISLGPIIGYPLTGTLIHTEGVRLVFIIYGAFGVVWCCLWFALARESPSKDPLISKAEREYIERTSSTNSTKITLKDVPWRKLFTSTAVLAIVFANIGRNWTFQFAQSGLPHFIEEIYKTGQRVTGRLMAIPFVIMAILTPLSGTLADCIIRQNCLSVLNTRRLFTGLGFSMLTTALVMLGFIRNLAVSITLISICLGSIGMATSGFAVNQLDVAPRFAGILMGLSNGIGTLSGVAAPIVAKEIAAHGYMSEWRTFFLISAVVTIIANILFCVLARGEEQEWAKDHSVAPAAPPSYGAMETEPLADSSKATEKPAEGEK